MVNIFLKLIQSVCTSEVHFFLSWPVWWQGGTGGKGICSGVKALQAFLLMYIQIMTKWLYVHREILGHHGQTLLGNQVYNRKNREKDLSCSNLSRNLPGFGGATRFHTSAASWPFQVKINSPREECVKWNPGRVFWVKSVLGDLQSGWHETCINLFEAPNNLEALFPLACRYKTCAE